MRKVSALFVLTALCGVMIPPSFVHGQNSSRRLVSDTPDQQAQESRPEAVPDQYFVAFRDGVTGDDIEAVRFSGIRVRKRFPEVRAIAIKINNPHQLAALARNPRIEYIEQEPMRYKMDLSTSQLVPSISNGLYGLLTTKATTVHGRGTTGAGINVGVADTSLNYTHPDIQANYRGGIDTVGNDDDPFNHDGETHGTHVAGTILGVNNGAGVFGVAYSANLYHARVLGPNGGTSADIMDGVRWLVEQRGCKVVNLSLGGGLKSRTEENFYKSMRSKGALIVAATGNDGATRISYPAGYATNIAVGAVDRNNAIASFSNRGTNIDVVAPGVGVLSSVPLGQGSESSVSNNGTTYTAYGFEFAGNTSGYTGKLVDCGLGQLNDFPSGVPIGYIALIQRGTIGFAEKVTNAMNAGARGAIIYNNVSGDFTGTLGGAGNWIPAVSVSQAVGTTLKAQAQVGASATVVNQVSDWDHYDGTSMATPHTTGVIALIWSANQALSNTTVESYLFATCTDLGAAGYDTTYGRGLINADAAVAKTGK